MTLCLLIAASRIFCMKCSKCGTEMTSIETYRCPSCSKMTCLKHRMPENHDCYSEDSGVEIVDMMGKPEPVKPAPAAPAPAAQPAPAKKKRFGFF